MIGKLTKKFKVIHSIRPKLTLNPKKRIKRERDNTPQRWSRRIRSLPPIPFDVLNPSRKVRKIRSDPPSKENKVVRCSKSLYKGKFKESSSDLRQEHFFQKRGCLYDNDSSEIVRIIPVVVHVKRNKAKLRSISEDFEIQIKDRSSNNLRSYPFREKFEEECSDLEQRWSQRLKNMSFFRRYKENK